MSKVYYNEFEPSAALWLRELIDEGVLPNGDIDTRDIRDVSPSDLDGYAQCHFFAGIGGWPYALRLAAWPEGRQVWTGSCPCQPFSSAGKRGGLDDSRHLWPAFRWLIAQCRPTDVIGEQVASADGRAWLSGVRADLEALGYVCGGADLCAAGIGAPHIRQRLFWCANSIAQGEHNRGEPRRKHSQKRRPVAAGGDVIWSDSIWWPCRDGKLRRVPARQLGDVDNDGCNQGREGQPTTRNDGTERTGAACGIRNAKLERRPSSWNRLKINTGTQPEAGCKHVVRTAADGGLEAEPALQFVADGLPFDLVQVRMPDGWEVDWEAFPLAETCPGRTAILKGAGNAIVPALAAEFIKAYMGETT